MEVPLQILDYLFFICFYLFILSISGKRTKEKKIREFRSECDKEIVFWYV